MENAIIIAVLSTVVFAAIRAIIKAKKRGQGCVGCPYAGDCGTCHKQ